MRRHAALQMLLHDRSTTAGSVIGVVAIVFLVGQQLAVLFGLFSLMSVLVDHSGADIWILSENTDNITTAGTLPMRYVERALGLEEVEWAEPLVTGGGQLRRKDGKTQAVQVVGLSLPRMAGGPWRFAQGSLDALFEGEAVTVDQLDAKLLGSPAVNDVVEINGQAVRIRGLTRNIRGFSGALVFTNADKARSITGLAADRCNQILIKLRPGSNVNDAVARLEAVLPRAEAIPTPVLSAKTRLYYVANTGIGTSIGFSTLVGLLVGVVIIMLTMYTTVLNRQREFAVLRAFGARRRDITVVVMFQALIIGLIGILVGFLMLAGFLAGTYDTRLPANLPIWFAPAHAALTLVLCLLGSLLAVRRATSIEPASAFR
ncbi:MAG: ABC transporter permease [candidate division WOR-3 bacterium]